jgi:hypothetical protein
MEVLTRREYAMGANTPIGFFVASRNATKQAAKSPHSTKASADKRDSREVEQN